MSYDDECVMRPRDWRTLGEHPNWLEAGRVISALDPTRNLKRMTLRDIADFFDARGLAVPQGGRDPESPITDEDYRSLVGGMN